MVIGPETDRLIDAALAEDVGVGDVTTAATVDAGAEGRAEVVAKQPLVVAGLPLFARVLERVDHSVAVRALQAEGTEAAEGARLASLEGRLAPILTAERVALNFLQRLCGIATVTRRYVQAIPAGSRTVVLDTRKTTPGLRALERYAVRCGGGRNHRSSLDGGLLVKENHIAASGSIAEALRRLRATEGPALRVEVEVTDLDELDEALDAGAEVVMLDNMELPEIEEAVRRARGRALVEVSGGVTVDRAAEVAALGADFVSVGALTHSAPAADLSLLVTC